MEKVNKYLFFCEESTAISPSGIPCKSAVYHAYAKNEERARELAEEQEIDLTGFEIELDEIDARDSKNKPITEVFKEE